MVMNAKRQVIENVRGKVKQYSCNYVTVEEDGLSTVEMTEAVMQVSTTITAECLHSSMKNHLSQLPRAGFIFMRRMRLYQQAAVTIAKF